MFAFVMSAQLLDVDYICWMFIAWYKSVKKKQNKNYNIKLLFSNKPRCYCIQQFSHQKPKLSTGNPQRNIEMYFKLD